jgi:hypothetical protein
MLYAFFLNVRLIHRPPAIDGQDSVGRRQSDILFLASSLPEFPTSLFPHLMNRAAPAYNDYAPVSELYAGLNSALNWMLLQPADDSAGTMVLLPTWPCEWDVSFKLWGPLNTTVEVVYAAGVVKSAVVTPAAREKNVVWAGCVSESGLTTAALPGRVLGKTF